MDCTSWHIEGWQEAVETYLESADATARGELTELRRALRATGPDTPGAKHYPALGDGASVVMFPGGGVRFDVTADCYLLILGLSPLWVL